MGTQCWPDFRLFLMLLTPPDLKSELRQSGQFDYRGDFIPLRRVGLNGGLHSETYWRRCGAKTKSDLLPLRWLNPTTVAVATATIHIFAAKCPQTATFFLVNLML